jgi:ABC-2 type transport system permease protein
MIVFITANGLFMWVFPGSSNVLESGYANIDSLFVLAPWIFLFLIPAITMRLFADEKKTGTIELLLTRPLKETSIIVAKLLAAITLVLISLFPALLYFMSVYMLGNPVGNIDTGGTWGSFIGLFFLASAYASIGVFSSSLTSNQIVAFIIGVITAFFFYIGFESLSFLNFFSGFDSFIINLGINEHYRSMSRGVIDSRDILYFISIIIIFVLFTKIKLQSRKW